MSQDVKVIILSSGHSIIGHMEEDDDFFCIYNPMVVEKTEKYGLTLGDMLQLAEEDYIVVKKSKILSQYTPREPIVKFYYKIVNLLDKAKIDENVYKAIEEIDLVEQKLSDLILFGQTSKLVH